MGAEGASADTDLSDEVFAHHEVGRNVCEHVCDQGRPCSRLVEDEAARLEEVIWVLTNMGLYVGQGKAITRHVIAEPAQKIIDAAKLNG